MPIVLITRLLKTMQALSLGLLLSFSLPSPSLADTVNDNPSINLSESKQTQAGIQTLRPLLTHFQAELQTTATVVDLQSLLNLREQYLTALAEQQGATAAVNYAKQAMSRTEALYRNGVNSQRQLQGLQMQLSSDQARLNSNRYRLQSLNENLLSNWGDTLAAWAKSHDNPTIQAFINTRQALLLVTLPANQSLPEPVTQIAVDPNGNRQNAQIAQLISKAPYGSEISQGETYFFQTPRSRLRTGMRLSAWVTAPGTAQTGFNIPHTALIWHAGQAGIYLKIAPGQFIRQPLQHYFPNAQGYFVAEKLPENAEIVTTGAQLLLSQELRAIIPTEDDGDD